MIKKGAAVTHTLLSSHSISHPFITTIGYTPFLPLESSFTIGVSKAPRKKSLLRDSPSRFILRGEKTYCLLFLQSRTESQVD